ncbi:type II secretion system protein N [uncultured Marinobacter sp.]|uniref:type II secretion system protein N n=1 Tax=uncultured Marinobacter sp. TaxID=187379 RepID=UPI0030D78705
MPRRKVRVLPRWVSRWLANLLLLGFVTHLALAAAWLTWTVLWQEQPVAPVYQVGAEGQSLASIGRPLAAFEMFGRPPMDQVAAADTVRRNAPQTSLRLRLEGVLVSEQADQSSAIVSGSGTTTAHYRVGEMLPGNAELVEVEPGRILIRRQGAFETLAFDEEFSASGQVEEVPEVTQGSPEDFVAEAQARLDREGATALLAFGLRPVEDGGSQGYVFDGSNAMLRAINLQPGDVITSVNGYQLGDLDQDRQLLENLRSERQLEVEVERAGARFTVTYALPQ